jgi:hypothetical protein
MRVLPFSKRVARYGNVRRDFPDFILRAGADESVAAREPPDLSHGRLRAAVVVGHVEPPNLVVALVELQHGVLAVVGNHGMAVVEPLGGFGVVDRRLADSPHDVFVGIEFLHLAGHDQNVTVFEKLHIVTIVIGTIPKQRSIFLDLDEPFVVVVGAVDMRLATYAGGLGNV